MKFSAVAVLAAAAGASAGHVSNVTYTTEVVTAYTTYCPGPTEIVHGDKTYTVTKATTLTITDCPCTVTKPVITTSAVVCHHCSAPGYTNSTLINVPTQGKPEEPKPTGSKPSGKPETPTQVPVAAAGKVALSGAGLAGVVGLAAFFL